MPLPPPAGTVGERAPHIWGLEVATLLGRHPSLGLSSCPLPSPSAPPTSVCSGVAAGATLGGHWHSVIKTSVSLTKSYPLLGRGETQIIMNQFSSGQPSARASRGGSQTATGRGRRTLPSQYSLGAGQAARRGRLGLSLWWGRWAEGSLWSGTPSHRLPGMDARGAPASTRQAMEKRRPSSAPPEICPRPRTAPAPLPPPSPPPAPGLEWVTDVAQRAGAMVTAPLASRPARPAPREHLLRAGPAGPGAVRRRPPPGELASCRERPAASDKLAICCCLSSVFVMQIPEPAAGAR